MKTLTLGFSPCPNDTFMFEAIVSGKVSADNLVFNPVLMDVEQLNVAALKNEPDITKISFSNYPAVSENYRILNAGSAMGKGCGPLLISKKDFTISQVAKLRIAIPGRLTTANLLLSIFFPVASNRVEMVFSDIEQAVLEEKADAGLIIHESRFTYAARGLKKIADMGELWEKATGSPIPLGCIIIRRSLGEDICKKVDDLLRESIRTAMENPEGAMSYVKMHAREMEPGVISQHIALYVNKFSLDLGTEGRKAIELLFAKGKDSGLLSPVKTSGLFC